jgi:SecD/SecF fusion protein
VNNPGETPGTTYEIDTPNTNSSEVKDAVVSKFGTLLNIELKSNFDGVGQKFDDVMNNLVVPINDDTMQVAGITLNNQGAFRGGAAIVLKNLQPPLSADEIRNRIGRARLQAQVNSDMARYRDVSVQTDAGSPDVPATTAIVLTSDPDIHYKDDPARWRDEIAAPTWKLINDAVNNPPQLQKVNNFDAQVAGDTQQEAYGALALSLVIIMAYIWLRFGNLQFGTATVLAMIHDTFLAIAAIGLAHLAVEFIPPLANGLLLEPFRLNLTLVAAILTIMSYSMIDTIVVFDRIRENRGKFGHLDRQVINDSINQTLSRTLLTAGTTIVTVSVMYIVGGPGIHGFTFVLLFGILVGTYSSIAIAAPMLLLSRKATSNPPSMPPGRREVGQLQRA